MQEARNREIRANKQITAATNNKQISYLACSSARRGRRRRLGPPRRRRRGPHLHRRRSPIICPK